MITENLDASNEVTQVFSEHGYLRCNMTDVSWRCLAQIPT